ncbi:uncharacterized protein LOC143284336 [Babylonia areolata]|uniref:uncharacterized protein LOC143284336 n=1 Tax=Babylonia areolata TaxID=304850 RepID=UPI003FD4D3A3
MEGRCSCFLVGHVLSVLTYLTSDLWPDHLLATVIVGALLRSLLGKGAVFSMALTTLVADLTPADQLSSKFALIMALRNVGICLGSILSAVMLDYSTIFLSMLTTAVLQVLCFLVGFLGIKDAFQTSSETQMALPNDKEDNNALTRMREKVESDDADSVSDACNERTYLVLKRKENSSRKKVLIVLMMVTSFMTQAIGAGQTEVIALTASVPPLSWPGSWYGYLQMIYYGTGGLFLRGLGPCVQKVLSATRNMGSAIKSCKGGKNAGEGHNSSTGDMLLLLMSVLSCVLCSVWVGLASEWGSTWQIFAAYIVGSVVCTSSSSLRCVLSRVAHPEEQGKLMAVLAMLEVLARVLWPMLHTTVYVLTVHLCPSLVYYLMGGEVTLLLPVLYLMHRQLVGAHAFGALLPLAASCWSRFQRCGIVEPQRFLPALGPEEALGADSSLTEAGGVQSGIVPLVKAKRKWTRRVVLESKAP